MSIIRQPRKLDTFGWHVRRGLLDCIRSQPDSAMIRPIDFYSAADPRLITRVQRVFLQNDMPFSNSIIGAHLGRAVNFEVIIRGADGLYIYCNNSKSEQQFLMYA